MRKIHVLMIILEKKNMQWSLDKHFGMYVLTKKIQNEMSALRFVCASKNSCLLSIYPGREQVTDEMSVPKN